MKGWSEEQQQDRRVLGGFLPQQMAKVEQTDPLRPESVQAMLLDNLDRLLEYGHWNFTAWYTQQNKV